MNTKESLEKNMSERKLKIMHVLPNGSVLLY